MRAYRLLLFAALAAPTPLSAEEPGQEATVPATDRDRIVQYAYLVALAKREWEAGTLDRAQEILEECPTSLRNWEWRYLKWLCGNCALRIAGGQGKEFEWAGFSPDGTRLALLTRRTVSVVDCADGRKVMEHPVRGGWVFTCAFSPDGALLAVPGFLLDAASGEERRKMPEGNVSCVAFSPDGRRLALGGGGPRGEKTQRRTGQIKVLDLESDKEPLRIEETEPVLSVAFSPDNRWLASCAGDIAIVGPFRAAAAKLWDASTGALVRTFEGHRFWVTCVAFSPDGKRLATAGARWHP